jgi:hypothetical protein
MFAPLAVIGEWSDGTIWLVSFFLGIGFGFVLEQAGFGNSRKLALQFYFRDLTVFKVMFTAIATAMTGIVFLTAFGWLDIDGGLIMGIGFAVGGYCPGTSLVGLSTLKIDALFYLIGIFAGIFVFGETAPLIEPFFSGEYSGFMGRATIPQFIGVSSGVVGFFVVLMALGGFMGSEWLEKKFGGSK